MSHPRCKSGTRYDFRGVVHFRTTVTLTLTITLRILMWCENGTEKRKSFMEFAIFPIFNGVKTLRTQDTSDSRHFGISAELSVRHFGTSAELSGHIGTSAEVSDGHFGTSGGLCLCNYVKLIQEHYSTTACLCIIAIIRLFSSHQPHIN